MEETLGERPLLSLDNRAERAVEVANWRWRKL